MSMVIEQQSIQAFLNALADKSPTPGGGAVASVTASLAAALGNMVVRYSQGKKSLADYSVVHDKAVETLTGFVSRALELAESDAIAYAALNALWKREKDDPVRMREWGVAVAQAIEAPRQVLSMCVDMMELLDGLTGKINAMLKSDLAIAAVLADAAARSAAWNVRINLPLLDDEQAAEQMNAQVEQDLQATRSRCERIEQACR